MTSFRGDFRSKSIFFPDPPCIFMLIRRGNDVADLIFFSPKQAQLLFRQLQKLSARNIAALKCESRKTKFWVPWYPPYAVQC